MFWRFPYQKTVPPMPEVKPPRASIPPAPVNIPAPTPKPRAEFEPSTRFHAFCSKCYEMEPERFTLYSNGKPMLMNSIITCKHYDKCRQIAKEIEDRLRG